MAYATFVSCIELSTFLLSLLFLLLSPFMFWFFLCLACLFVGWDDSMYDFSFDPELVSAECDSLTGLIVDGLDSSTVLVSAELKFEECIYNLFVGLSAFVAPSDPFLGYCYDYLESSSLGVNFPFGDVSVLENYYDDPGEFSASSAKVVDILTSDCDELVKFVASSTNLLKEARENFVASHDLGFVNLDALLSLIVLRVASDPAFATLDPDFSTTVLSLRKYYEEMVSSYALVSSAYDEFLDARVSYFDSVVASRVAGIAVFDSFVKDSSFSKSSVSDFCVASKTSAELFGALDGKGDSLFALRASYGSSVCAFMVALYPFSVAVRGNDKIYQAFFALDTMKSAFAVVRGRDGVSKVEGYDGREEEVW